MVIIKINMKNFSISTIGNRAKSSERREKNLIKILPLFIFIIYVYTYKNI